MRVSFMPRSAPAATVWMAVGNEEVAPTINKTAVRSMTPPALSTASPKEKIARSQTG